MSAKPARRSGSFKRDKKDPIDVVFEKVPTAEDGRAAAGEKAGSKTTFSSRAQHGIIGKALYLWVTPFLKLGGERTLQMDDLLPLPEGYLASNNSKRFEESLKRALERERDRLRARAEWDGEGKAPKDPFLPAVMWPLWHCFGGIILTGSLFKLLNDLIQFLPAVVLGGFLRFIAGKSHPLELFVAGGSVNGYGAAYCLLLFFIPVLRTVFEQVYFYYAQASGICIKGALGTAVYRKTMRLSAAGRDGSTTGEVLNHMQLDAQRVGDLMLFINVLWSGILQTVGYMTLLYFYIGWASLGGFAVMVILIPLQKAFFQMISKLRREQMKLTDRRVKLQNEALSGVKILKLNAWEEPLRKEVEGVRAEEMRKAKAVQNRNALNAAIMNTGPTLVAVAAFSLYSGAMGREMTPSVIFPSLSLFSLLRFPVMFYPRCLAMVADALVALRRLQKYFLLPEALATTTSLPAEVQAPRGAQSAERETLDAGDVELEETHTLEPRVLEDGVVASIAGGHFHWTALKPLSSGSSEKLDRPFLRDIDLTLRKGELTVVVGPVGSGKSALISALLGEMHGCDAPDGTPARLGAPVIAGTTSYVAQVAWVQSLSLKDNVLFGRALDEDAYARALECACLGSDVALLPLGDLTEIGEKGITLSGGQKQRTAIARAVYADADLVVMDDPLSALDAHVAKDLFRKCLSKSEGAFKDKAVLLVTHQLQFVHQADHVVVMADGAIVERGAYDELVQREGGAFKQLMESYHGEDENAPKSRSGSAANLQNAHVAEARKPAESDATVAGAAPGRDDAAEDEDARNEEEGRIGEVTESAAAERGGVPGREAPTTGVAAALAGTGDSSSRTKLESVASMDARDSKQRDRKTNTMTKEKREEGAISGRTYLAYIRAMGSPLLLSALMLMVIVERFLSVVSSVWLAFWSEEHWELSNGDYLAGFAGIGIGQAAVSWARTFSWALASLAAANSLHLALFSATLHTRLAFFDTTPLGRVIQRFTKDTETLDNTLVQSVSSFVSFGLLLLGTIVVMAWVMPVLMPCLVPIGALYYYVQWFFRPGYREAKRLDGISGSPIYAHFGETLNGISTIRAFGHQKRFIAENESRISVNQRADYTQKCGCDRWLPMRLETIGNSITFVVACLGVWQRGSTYAALVGLTLSYAIDMTGLLSWLIRIVSELESNMVSVERVTEYAALESEEATGAAARGGAKPVRPDWPSAGAIEFRNVQMRYRPGLPLVLRGVSFDVRAGEKVGICGRTGSGKSTLIVALWRLVEPCGGEILLDGVDVRSILLKDLRGRVTCIPQDPILFSGNVRDNLDPFKQHSDEKLWFALEAVQLKPAVAEHGVGLLAPVAEYGENFSAGQRQMLCLARALLRDTKVVCLDEATASVDLETDKVMQDVIADQFASRTIMTLAHRINTIIENDSVVCLDRGELVAKATPAEMLRDENSMFAKLVAETGDQSARNLRARAEECEAARAAGVPIRRVGSKNNVA
jgi:ABC-type multidrug transport system fused ATPase/permease subunit